MDKFRRKRQKFKACIPDGVKHRLLRELGLRIRFVRLNHNLTLNELAERSGLQATRLSAIEHGRGNITFLTLAQITAGLGLTFYAFCKESNTRVIRTRQKERVRQLEQTLRELNKTALEPREVPPPELEDPFCKELEDGTGVS